ncbi:MAG: diguanylate cyclase [Rubrivivax sp.]|jgi:diguanylate cyclase (GGDEF)-like protein|nr:diguanylate cyclase [Rubrivivax sp.]
MPTASEHDGLQDDAYAQLLRLPLPVSARALGAFAAHRGAALAVKEARSGRYLAVDEAYAALWGTRAGALRGVTDADLFDASIAVPLRAADQAALVRGGPLAGTHRIEWQGQRRDFSVLRFAAPAGAEGEGLLFAFWTDTTATDRQQAQLENALRQLEQQQRSNEILRRELADQALRDPETGLYSRPHFEDQFRRELDLSMREHREFALVLLGIDEPSARVRELGERAQARLLEAMGRLLRGGTRAMDCSCRFDAGRFAVLLSGVGLATAHARMEGLRRTCASQIVVLDGQELGFTVSIGVASFPHTAHGQSDLLAACEAALAEARRRGGNAVTLASIRFEDA